MFTNMFSKSFKSLFFLLLFVGFSSFAQAQAPAITTCQQMSNTLGTNYMVTWGSANAAQRAQWQTSGCYTSPQAAAPVAPAPVVAAPVAPAPVAAAVPFMGCQQMSNTLGTNHGVTWGNANAAQQAQWFANGCNTIPQAAAPVAVFLPPYQRVIAYTFPVPGCQWMSNVLNTNATAGSGLWGSANAAQQAQWTKAGCNTRPQAALAGLNGFTTTSSSDFMEMCIGSYEMPWYGERENRMSKHEYLAKGVGIREMCRALWTRDTTYRR